MASKHITIPDRTSSKFVLEKSLRLRESRSELKRKLASTPFESSPIAFQKLKIEEIQTEIDEERLNKEFLDIEHGEQKLTDNDYRKAQRNTNMRIISLGEDLWNHRRGLRDEEEKSGVIPPLGPDVQGAFVHTLLSLYKDPNISAKRSSSKQSAMRESAIQVYESRKDAPKGKLWCPIAQDYFNAKQMKAAHIVPSRLGSGLVEYLFGPGISSRLHTWDNCLMLCSSAKESFDNGNFILIPANPNESPIKTWKIQLTNTAAKNSDIGHKVLAELDGKNVLFKNDCRPAARFLYYHFVVTLLRNKRDRQPGFQDYSVSLGSIRPFATPGQYMRQSMLLVLAKNTGDLSVEEEARLLGEAGQETFEEEEQLDERAEEEIARRIYAVHDEWEDESDETEED